MESSNKTIADIIAEMRMVFNRSWHDIDRERARGFADRIEAAWKREKAEIEASALSVGGIVEASRQTGNAAAMRDALEAFVEYSELVCRMGMFNRDRLVAITTKARDALAAPPRNCDVGTVEEQDARFVTWRY